MEKKPAQDMPDSFELMQTLGGTGHKALVREISWSPDGKKIATASNDSTVCIWDGKTERQKRRLIGHRNFVTSVRWSPDSKMLASGSNDGSVMLWHPNKDKSFRTLNDHSAKVYCVSWSPDGKMLASGSKDTVIIINKHIDSSIHDEKVKKITQRITGLRGSVNDLLWINDNRLLSASRDETVCLWDTESGKIIWKFTEHSAAVLCVAVSPNGKFGASGSSDKTVHIWNLESGKPVNVLQGHTGRVLGISFSHDSRMLASKSADGTVRLWRLDIEKPTPVTIMKEPSSEQGGTGGVAFHPKKYFLALRDDEDFSIRIWKLHTNNLFFLKPTSDTQFYKNAKVVLLGNNAVGKTALSKVLTNRDYEATDEATHGRNVWMLDEKDIEITKGLEEKREIWLWDLAGHPQHSLIHQMHLKKVSIALLVFDPCSDMEPFEGVLHWYRSLRQALDQKGWNMQPKIFLVAARTDRSESLISKKQIEKFTAEHDFEDSFQTSAKTEREIPDLITAIKKMIDWDKLPGVTSTKLFYEIKQFFKEKNESGYILNTTDKLFNLFVQSNNEKQFTDGNIEELRKAFDTCITNAENQGIVQSLSNGEYVLLKPELLDAYCFALINKAANNTEGMGFIAEEDVLLDNFFIPTRERVEKNLNKILVRETIGELIKHDIVFRETTKKGVNLVFPAQIKQEFKEAPHILDQYESTIFTFEGSVLNIYTTLVVRLSNSEVFKKKQMWKNVSIFIANPGEECGIKLKEIEEGKGVLTLFFNEKVKNETRQLFEDVAFRHLRSYASQENIKQYNVPVCNVCHISFSKAMVKACQEKGIKTLTCPVCKAGIQISTHGKKVAGRTSNMPEIAAINITADSKHDQEASLSAIEMRRLEGDYDVFFCYSNNDKNQVKKIRKELMKNGILPWLDDFDPHVGKDSENERKKMLKKVKTAIIFLGSSSLDSWLSDSQETAVNEIINNKDSKAIPVFLPGKKYEPKLPNYLSSVREVDFRVEDMNSNIYKLIWGITGEIRNENCNVFLSYDKKDVEQVTDIYSWLKEHGINPWFDPVCRRPGTTWQQSLNEQEKNFITCIIFHGKKGVTPWQSDKIKVYLNKLAKKTENDSLLPVGLEGVVGEAKIPPFLKKMKLLYLRKSDPDSFRELIAAITYKLKLSNNS